jgi:hypothetical protein
MAQADRKNEMTQSNDANCLRNIVRESMDARKTQVRLSPAWIATEAMAKLGAEDLQKAKPLVYLAAHLQLRQIARQACRKQFDDADEEALDPAQQEMFPGLQSRYPAHAAHAEEDEPSYVLRDFLGADDVAFNVQRLRREGWSKLARADALEAWWRHKKQVERKTLAGDRSVGTKQIGALPS